MASDLINECPVETVVLKENVSEGGTNKEDNENLEEVSKLRTLTFFSWKKSYNNVW